MNIQSHQDNHIICVFQCFYQSFNFFSDSFSYLSKRKPNYVYINIERPLKMGKDNKKTPSLG